jgi:hypothetical protein
MKFGDFQRAIDRNKKKTTKTIREREDEDSPIGVISERWREASI